MSLAEVSESRKARLIALRKRRAGEVADEKCVEALIRTRNFDPETRTLKKHIQDVEMEDTVEKAVGGLADRIIAEDEERRAQELDLFNIAPKRPNWDLKREMEKKMAKLERQTQRAIHTLIRQRLAAQRGQSDDLVGAMRAQEKEDMEEPNSDEE
ncbi:mRNA splicing factor [Neolentinus lepideus HHB14362 ss-1]|uniref:mRNA splicing factor n=1 Tax=Neolentinus lepideus HHB14362 ss-1 TaxID=1314782 RepID=A0A165TFI4_9AGAM|nr:mRNA splicing factor [Neolentinus lepideus HHB14362 ss-1]